jgi:hypothetical protein
MQSFGMTRAGRVSFDWASAVVSLAETNSSDLRRLVAAADLDPTAGDLVNIDLSDLDLRGQDLLVGT